MGRYLQSIRPTVTIGASTAMPASRSGGGHSSCLEQISADPRPHARSPRVGTQGTSHLRPRATPIHPQLHQQPARLGQQQMKVCNVAGCPTLTANSRCDDHERDADRARGTASQRGYTSKGHQAFREAVLTRDPLCQCPDACTHHLSSSECLALSTVADHWPRSRRDLELAGENPNDPGAGRGLCKSCHDRHTAAEQPGGWNQR